MTETEAPVHLSSKTSSGQGERDLLEDMSRDKESDCRQGGVEDEPVNVALAPPCGDHVTCSCEREACSCVEVRWMEGSLQSLQLQLQFLISKADGLHEALVNGQSQIQREALAATVPSFLYTCQPFFNHLESTARSTTSQLTPGVFDMSIRRVQLLDFSQQLCDRLEQLVLTFSSYDLLCVDEAEADSLSHFCVGQTRLDGLRLTTFLYCKPTPYLAQVDTGLHKRMRWNVERVGEEQQQADEEQAGERERREAETAGDTEYYFLCFEDEVKMWSIGQWVQVSPDPNTEDIYDWIMCEVPQASYRRLLLLGSDEPASSNATDYLQQLLSHRQEQQTTE